MKLIVLYILTPTCIEPTMHGSYFGENDIPKKIYVYWINLCTYVRRYECSDITSSIKRVIEKGLNFHVSRESGEF